MSKKIGLFTQIRILVSKIPKGKVATYGQIAQIVGITDSRQVGFALFGNQDPNIPCHRVVKKDGFIAPNYSLGGGGEQIRRLKIEGITFIKTNQVNLSKHYFSPNQ